MDQAIVAGVSAVGGVVVGALGAVLGPLLTQRRNQDHERSTLTDRDVREALEITAQLRTAGAMWERDMGRVLRDVRAGRSVDLKEFDDSMRSLEQEMRQSVNRLVAYRLHVSAQVSGRVFLPMGEAEDMLREVVSDSHGSMDALQREIPGAIREVWYIRHELDEILVQEVSTAFGAAITTPPYRFRRRA
ncbi:hypothetical protein [Streptomyces sp. NPDC002588]|uniref:hypothetical protein n=1 Tax=Streptomyces sp. NPDC002588 TaxID=3154419 RepID=UPI003324740D